ncbi:hypothetical protein ACX3O0_05105 [Homoserinimonas sp. A447]
MRKEFLQLPPGGLSNARSVLLDWNISARIASVHKRQTDGVSQNLGAVEMTRLRKLAIAIPDGAQVISAFSAAEPEIRRLGSTADAERYNARADTASFYLTEGRGYLLHLLDGGETGGLVIESEVLPVDDWTSWLRSWFMVSYAALLQAVVIHREDLRTPEERFDRYRFWLEHELKVSASREAWIGFCLLAGTGDLSGRVRRFLKIDASADICDSVWGATWDLMYSRLPAMFSLPAFRKYAEVPAVFVTDDEALVQVLEHLSPAFGVENAMGVQITGDTVLIEALDERVHEAVRAYMNRERRRVLTRSEGIMPKVKARAKYLARRAQARLSADTGWGPKQPGPSRSWNPRS